MEEIIAREDNLIEQEKPAIVEPIKTRDNRIDIIKAIAIILMVIGHAIEGNMPTYFEYTHNFIYSFHMAVFFMASGFCFKEDSVKDGKSYLRFIWKKVKSLYIPYVLFNVACLLLNNVFVSLNLYGQEMYIQSFPIKQILKVFILSGGATPFGGATWFLRTLFMIYVLHATLIFFSKSIRYNQIFAILIACIGLVIFCFCEFGLVDIPGAIFPCCYGYVEFVMGLVLGRYKGRLNFEKKISICIFVVSFIILFAMLFIQNNFSSSVNNIIDVLINSLLGWMMLWCLADIINKGKSWLVKSLCYIGKNTMFIVLWHFVFFKPVSLIYIWISKLPISRLAESPVLILSNWWLWIVYTIVSIALCLLLREVYYLIKTKIVNAINKKKVKV